MTATLRSIALGPALAAGMVFTCSSAQAALQTFVGSYVAEAPGASGSGTLTMLYDTVARTLDISTSFAGLSGTTTAAHIHCCTTVPLTGTAAVVVGSLNGASPNVIPGFPLGVSSGSFSHTVDLSLAGSYSAAFLSGSGSTTQGAEDRLIGNLASGQAYFNVHTTNFPAGEIRAFVSPVPEPATWALMVGGLTLAGAAAGRRRKG